MFVDPSARLEFIHISCGRGTQSLIHQFAMADVFVLNSEYEGLSHTLLEVLNLGTPIIASGVCGNPEVVEDGVNGLLVDPRDPETLRAAIHKLLQDSRPSLAIE